jgi:D-arabinose 1-dehydrogenase-like Zn-dependent alcohol dehydrogenase
MPKMRAVQVSRAGGDFELVERDIPEPGPDQVRVRVAACGICHSDVIVKEGVFPVAYPRVPGHEVVGTIDKAGSAVAAWKEGERVGVGWHGGHCFVCNPCRRGHFHLCDKAAVTGLNHDGGYAEYMIASQHVLARVPADLKFADAAPLMCAGITTYNALRNSGAQAGDLVAVQGVGGLGHLGVQFANKLGFRTAAISRGKSKEKLARELGADIYLDSDDGPIAEQLTALGGARVILATAPNGKAIAEVIEGLGPNGLLILAAAPGGTMEVSPLALIMRKRSIQGWYSGHARDSEDTLNFSVLRSVLPRVELYPLEKVNEAYERMISNQARFRVVLEMV